MDAYKCPFNVSVSLSTEWETSSTLNEEKPQVEREAQQNVTAVLGTDSPLSVGHTFQCISFLDFCAFFTYVWNYECGSNLAFLHKCVGTQSLRWVPTQ